ncbi:MAG: hypothetical protein ABFD83_13785 [Armatimonadota bacterium]
MRLHKAITAEDRRVINKINNRRLKGWTWDHVASDLKFHSASHVYNWVNDRAILDKDTGRYIAIDKVTIAIDRPIA